MTSYKEVQIGKETVDNIISVKFLHYARSYMYLAIRCTAAFVCNVKESTAYRNHIINSLVCDLCRDCGEMHAADSRFETSPVCASQANVIYAWGLDAPELNLPKGVAFKLGGNTDIQYLVLQVHYKNVTPFLPPCM